MAYKAGIVIALILLVPIVITFIVSVSTGGGLAVFAVLTASMLLIASLGVSIWEIQISVRALEIHLRDMEK